jgi:hypothetical protein
VPLPVDATRCVGRTGYLADSIVCPLRNSCERHVDIPTEPNSTAWAMHLCRLPNHAAYIPAQVCELSELSE